MFNKYVKFILFIILIYVKPSDAQQWIKYFGGTLEDKAYAITADNQNYVYIGGYTTVENQGTDFYLVKINPISGNTVWSRTYNGPASQDDKVYAITVDRENNIYVAGFSTGIGTGTDMTVIKYSPSGSRRWIGTYNSTTNGDDVAYDVAVDDSFNVYITGFVTLTGTDMYLAKFNSGGVYQWGRFYGGTKNLDDKAYAIQIDDLDNIYIGGYTKNNGTRADFTAIKYNRITGDELWAGKYDGPLHFDDVAVCMVLSESGHLYLSGSGNRDSSGDTEDFLTVKVNTENGDTIWVRSFNGSGGKTDKVYAITVDKQENTYITGFVTAANNMDHHALNQNFMTIKYSPEGNMLWNTSYDTNFNNEIAKGLCLSSSGDYLFVTGSTRKGNDPDSQDIATVKYDALSGEQLQVSIIKGSGNGEDDATSILLDTSDNTYLAGNMKTNNRDLDIIAVKYQGGNLIEVKNISTNVPNNFTLYQNYPNPFNPSTTIKFDVVKQGPVNLVIYDILGRQVDILVNENMRPGSYEVNYSSAKLSSGVYFYKMTADSYRDVKKMILIK